MTIKQIVECDSQECDAILEIDSSEEGVDSAMNYADWGENPENSWEHFCPECLPGVLKNHESDEDEDE